MPNQFSTNYGPIPSLFSSEKSKLNFNRRVEDSYFNWKTRVLLWFRVLPPANAVGLGCHLFSLPLKKKLCPQWPHSVHSRCNWFCGYFTSPIDTTNDCDTTNQARKEKQTRKGKKNKKTEGIFILEQLLASKRKIKKEHSRQAWGPSKTWSCWGQRLKAVRDAFNLPWVPCPKPAMQCFPLNLTDVVDTSVEGDKECQALSPLAPKCFSCSSNHRTSRWWSRGGSSLPELTAIHPAGVTPAPKIKGYPGKEKLGTKATSVSQDKGKGNVKVNNLRAEPVQGSMLLLKLAAWKWVIHY